MILKSLSSRSWRCLLLLAYRRRTGWWEVWCVNVCPHVISGVKGSSEVTCLPACLWDLKHTRALQTPILYLYNIYTSNFSKHLSFSYWIFRVCSEDYRLLWLLWMVLLNKTCLLLSKKAVRKWSHHSICCSGSCDQPSTKGCPPAPPQIWNSNHLDGSCCC